MLLFHSYYIYGTWRSKEVEGLKSSYRGKLREGRGESHTRSKEEGQFFWGSWPLSYFSIMSLSCNF